jgi:two-component system, OmpR family, KDP operon response regulator KdpE
MNNSILIAAADDAGSQLLGNALQAEGYGVIHARTVREATQLLFRHMPDLILLDLNLPDKDGWEFLQLIKQIRTWMPVIVITSRPGPLARASRLGAAGLMEKPLDLPLMFGAIGHMLDRCRRERVEHEMEGFYDELPHSPPPCCLLTSGTKHPPHVDGCASQTLS